MISRQSGSRDILYLYTADDERIWAYDLIANRSDYTIRDLDKKVLRVFDENWGSWSWKKDFLHRGTTLLGSSSPAGAYHYTVDHLGTPRYITNAWRQQIGRHAYYPFGEESTNPAQNDEFRKFTGHERDKSSPGSVDYLDYMHARYYRPVQGRFLSIDPVLDVEKAVGEPQRWNRYAYVINNPIRNIDPDGRETVHAMMSERRMLEKHLTEEQIREVREIQGIAAKGVFAGMMALVPGPDDVLLGAFVGRFGMRMLARFAGRSDDVMQTIFEVGKNKGNFGVGSMSREKADQLGRAWVGDNARPLMKNGKQTGLISEDGSKVYRSASEKRKTGRYQANLEEITTNSNGQRAVIRNAHIDIQ
ncbi:MAG: RHS repeat-associated core domain-containing protein, partial [Thioalkalivibrio sp.]|nr:RHS repeat-associated core domain-containing protein [Thioalkalivibrio sp.]